MSFQPENSFRAEASKIGLMYDYLIAPAEPLPREADITFVFGRKSEHLLTAAAEAARISMHFIVSGGVGKDSGDLPFQGVYEADYVADYAHEQGATTPERTHRDYKALNGRQNARAGLDIITNEIGAASIWDIVLVTHPTQTRRLGDTFAAVVGSSGRALRKPYRYKSNYPFDTQSPFDQYEAASEIVGLDELSRGVWPTLERPGDLPEDLLEYARAVTSGLGKQFKEQGIRNPSTADDTRRDISFKRTMFFPPYSELSPPRRLANYASNTARLGVLLARETVNRLTA